MVEYVAVAVTGREPSAVAAALDGRLPAKLTGVRRRGSTLVVLCEPRDGATSAQVAEAVMAVAERASPARDPVTLGVAGPRRGPAGAQTAMLEAEHALAVGRAKHAGQRTTHFEELGVYRFVLGRPTSEIRELCDRVLGPLSGGSARDEDMRRTLEAFLRENGSLNAVARSLYLHRNTVRRRLRRIAAVIGADLDDPDGRVLVRLALLGREALAQLDEAPAARRAQDGGGAAADWCHPHRSPARALTRPRGGSYGPRG